MSQSSVVAMTSSVPVAEAKCNLLKGVILTSLKADLQFLAIDPFDTWMWLAQHKAKIDYDKSCLTSKKR